MSQRKDALAVSDQASSVSDLPAEIWQDEVFRHLDTQSLFAATKTSKLFNVLSDKSWQAKHTQYFPNANQESIQWLRGRGEAWFSLFMNDIRHSNELIFYVDKFKGTNITEVMDCLIRNDEVHLKSLAINWASFYDWLVCPVETQSDDYVEARNFYFLKLVSRSSRKIQSYIYQELQEVVSQFTDIKRQNAQWLIAVVCHQNLLPFTSWSDNAGHVCGLMPGINVSALDVAAMAKNENAILAALIQTREDNSEHRALEIAFNGFRLAVHNGCAKRFSGVLADDPNLFQFERIKILMDDAVTAGNIKLMMMLFDMLNKQAPFSRQACITQAKSLMKNTSAFYAFCDVYLPQIGDEFNDLLSDAIASKNYDFVFSLLKNVTPVQITREHIKLRAKLHTQLLSDSYVSESNLLYLAKSLQFNSFDVDDIFKSLNKIERPQNVIKCAKLILDHVNNEKFNSELLLVLCQRVYEDKIKLHALPCAFALLNAVLQHKNTRFHFSHLLLEFANCDFKARDVHGMLSLLLQGSGRISLENREVSSQLEVVESLLKHYTVRTAPADSCVRGRLMLVCDELRAMSQNEVVEQAGHGHYKSSF